MESRTLFGTGVPATISSAAGDGLRTSRSQSQSQKPKAKSASPQTRRKTTFQPEVVPIASRNPEISRPSPPDRKCRAGRTFQPEVVPITNPRQKNDLPPARQHTNANRNNNPNCKINRKIIQKLMPQLNA